MTAGPLSLCLLADSVLVRFSELGCSKGPARRTVAAPRTQWPGDRLDHFVKY